MSLMYLSEVCVPGWEGWWEVEAEPKLMVVLSATASLSCFLLVLDSSSLEMALVLQSHPSPPWQQRGLVPAVGQWERQLPGVPQGFFFQPRGSCPGSAGAQSLCHQLSVAAFQAGKGRSGPGSGLPKHSQQTLWEGELVLISCPLIFCSQSNGHFDHVYLKWFLAEFCSKLILF